jgi:hypothetical protein
MLNRPWIDPRDVDWTDALNGVRNPGFRQNNNPFVYSALNDPFMQALRQAEGIEPRIFVCPDPQSQFINPGATYDYEVPSEPNTWLWALTASTTNRSDPSDGFMVQITDSGTGASLFSQPLKDELLSGIVNSTPQGSGNGYRGPLYFLDTPHLFEPPSYPVVRIINVSLNQILKCRVTLYTCVEYDL